MILDQQRKQHMKITRDQLKRIIHEAVDSEPVDSTGLYELSTLLTSIREQLMTLSTIEGEKNAVSDWLKRLGSFEENLRSDVKAAVSWSRGR